MKSVRSVFKIGIGPSSSHTMGPNFAAKQFFANNKDADSFKAILYGSLSKTGKGHGTDRAIIGAFYPRQVEIIFNSSETNLPHPNTMKFFAYKNGEEISSKTYLSIGGGEIRALDEPEHIEPDIYKVQHFSTIAEICKARNMRLSDYVFAHEDKDFKKFLSDCWQTMCNAINTGLTKRGVLPGGLNLQRKAQKLYNMRHMDESPQTRENRIVCSYAFAVSEQNADCGTIVTAPTCGACGAVPAVLKYMQDKNGFSDKDIIRALAVAGLVGNIIRTNASISGAEAGCQAEIGSACSMAAAALAELFEMGIEQIEYAAEISLEHHLGLTCDPVCGLVQIPCIERNAVSAMRAINALSLANFLSESRTISFDTVVATMYRTGQNLSASYRETSEGGLAEFYRIKNPQQK